MARIKYGPIISDISGSIGSATFQKSLYGNTLRNKPRPHKNATQTQLNVRGLMIQCQYGWKALSVASRRQWDQFIAFSGQSINRDRGILLTGHTLYLKYNLARLLHGLTLLNSLAYKSAPLWPAVSSIQVDGNIMYCNYSGNITTLNIWPTFFISPRRPASQSFSKAGLRNLLQTSDTDTTSVYDANYSVIFGRDLVAGDIVHVKIQFWSRVTPILSSVQTGIFTVTDL